MIWSLLAPEFADQATKKVGEAMSNTGDDATRLIMTAILALILFGGIIWFVLWWRHQNRFASAPVGEEQIFQRLCDVSDLSRSESYMLRKMVFELGLANPLEPFTNPALFDEYGKGLTGNKAAYVKNIRNKLFA
ncbi:MAG: hypothetical protein KDB07_01420 [Planctomycetes bacterium]|nr:hypothetical protein [Planctomycetota bacterium]